MWGIAKRRIRPNLIEAGGCDQIGQFVGVPEAKPPLFFQVEQFCRVAQEPTLEFAELAHASLTKQGLHPIRREFCDAIDVDLGNVRVSTQARKDQAPHWTQHPPDLANPEFAVPTVLTLGLPAVFGALGLAAVFSAEVSSADAVLFMLSTSLSKDIYKRYLAPDASDAQVLLVARWAAIAGGVFGVLLAIRIPTVIDSLKVFYSVLSVSLFVPIVAGLHTRRPGVLEALAAIGVGITGLFAVRMSSLGEISPWLDPTALGILASGAAFAVVFAIRRPKS